MAVLVCIPTSSVRGFPFSAPSPEFIGCRLLDSSHSDQHEMVPHCGFDLRFSDQGTLKSLLQHHSSEASILLCSAFFIVQLSHLYMTTGKTIALTRRTFVGKVTSLLFRLLSRLVIAFLPRSKCLLISRLQSPSEVILEPQNKVCHYLHCFPIYLP